MIHRIGNNGHGKNLSFLHTQYLDSIDTSASWIYYSIIDVLSPTLLNNVY